MERRHDTLRIGAVIAAILLLACERGGPATIGGGPAADANGGVGGSGGADASGPESSGDARPTPTDARLTPDSDGPPSPDRPPSPDGPPPADSAGSEVAVEPACRWPTATGEQKVSVTIQVPKMLDGGMKRFSGEGALGTSGQVEGQPPLFQLADGATLQNVILGNPEADGVHCSGTCLLKNVWWEDVGEDAATARGSSASHVVTIDGGGARHAADKVFQHNGAGTMIIKNFCAEDFSTLYRSCGNCSGQYPRRVVMQDISVSLPAGTLAGVNENYGDTATFRGIFVHGGGVTICQRYQGNNTGAEPVRAGSGPDATVCLYDRNKDILLR